MTVLSRRLGFLLPLAVVLAILLLYLAAPIPVQVLRNAAFDQYQRWQPRPYADAPVRVVDIDEQSLARLGQWPWPRERLAELVRRLHDAGAAAIAFDVVFAESDRVSPRALASHWGLEGTVAEAIGALPDPDERFAEALRATRVVLGFTLEHAGEPPPPLEPGYRVVTRGDSALSSLPAYPAATLPIVPLREAAAAIGSISFQPDADGIVRRIQLLARAGDTVVPSLAGETLRTALGERNYVATALDGAPGLASLRIGRYQVPTTERGEAWIHYTAPRPQRYLPAWSVLDGSATMAPLRGALVLVGTSAKGLSDLRINALGAPMPGVEAHAQLLEQMLLDHHLERPAWATAVEALVIALGGVGLGLIALRTAPHVAVPMALAAIAMTLGASWWAFARWRLLVDPTLPTIALLLPFGVAGAVRHMATERRQRWIRQAFSRYVSPNLVAHLVDQPGRLALGGERRSCSFIFTDLAGFTSLMERIDPARAVELLNGYFDGMIEIVFRHEGTLDRIVGDAMAVMFSAPIEQPDHRQRAYACALELHRFARRYVETSSKPGLTLGATRIGVHAGEVIVGNFGGAAIFDYRALGDPVNVAARLETLNKQLGTEVCVSEAIREACPDAVLRPVGRMVLVGRTAALQVYQPLLAEDGLPAPSPDEAYEAAYRLMAADDPAAVAAFERLAAERPGDGLVAWQARRLRDGWTGDRIVLDEK